MQFAIDSNSSSLLELLYKVNDCIQKVETNFCWICERHLNELYIGNM
jgi:hypothetical protein